ncbi:uncharacterized protein [Montipora foliosa]
MENEDVEDQVDDVTMQDSSDEMSSGNSDHCPVCLMSLKEQLLGTPNNCPHVFCFECIQEWAKNATTCPVGRLPFTEILVHATKKGPVLQRIPVEQRQGDEDEEEDDPTNCEVCGECDREDRMLLCDGCDNGYHMECLTPPVEFVPLDEWYCPTCGSREDAEEEEEERAFTDSGEHSSAGTSVCEDAEDVMAPSLLRASRGRPRGRPRGSTARRFAISERPGTPRAARTVASTRQRGTLGRGRARGSSRARGRGQRRSSSRGKSSSTKRTSSGKEVKRKKAVSRIKKSKKKYRSKKKRYSKKTGEVKSKRTRKRKKVEEDEVSPFIYEPKRRGKTVHARLLESLNSTGRASEIGRSSSSSSSSMARIPFSNRVEPSCSFSLFGNAYALHDFDVHDDDQKTTSQKEDQAASPWTSAQSSNPDVLGSIFEDLDTLHNSNAQVSRDGKLFKTDVRSRDGEARNSSVKLTICKENEKKSSDIWKVNKETTGEKISSRDSTEFQRDNSKPSFYSQNKRNNTEKFSRTDNSFESNYLSSPRSHATSSKLGELTSPQCTSSTPFSSSYSKLSKDLLSTPKLSGFRIPKRSSPYDSQNERDKIAAAPDDVAGIEKKEGESVSLFSKYKIPKRVKNEPTQEPDGKTGVAKVGRRSTKNLAGGSKHNPLFLQSSSQEKFIANYSCTTVSKIPQSAPSCSYIERQTENLKRKHFRNTSSSATASSVIYSTGITSCCANNITFSTPSSCTSAPSTSSLIAGVPSSGKASPVVTPSSDRVACHATEIASCSLKVTASSSTVTSPELAGGGIAFSNNLLTRKPRSFLYSSTPSTNKTLLTRVAPLIDERNSSGGKEQRLSNIEIIKRLKERQRNMREKVLSDPLIVDSSRSSSDTGLMSPPREEFLTTSKSPSSCRTSNLPIAVVKPSPQTSGGMVTTPILVSSSSGMSSVKSIASGIINVHCSNTQEFTKVRKESNPSNSNDNALEQEQQSKVAGVSGDRQRQRKLGIARLQRQQQIVDEVKLALKPFFRRGEVSKDDYKLIMKKSVEKIKESSSSVDRERVVRLVKKYIKKIKAINSTAPL